MILETRIIFEFVAFSGTTIAYVELKVLDKKTLLIACGYLLSVSNDKRRPVKFIVYKQFCEPKTKCLQCEILSNSLEHHWVRLQVYDIICVSSNLKIMLILKL